MWDCDHIALLVISETTHAVTTWKLSFKVCRHGHQARHCLMKAPPRAGMRDKNEKEAWLEGTPHAWSPLAMEAHNLVFISHHSLDSIV